MDKPFWQSKTFWSALVGASMMALGVNDGDVPFTAVQVSDSIVTLIGTAAFAGTIYGRRKAQGSITLR